MTNHMTQLQGSFLDVGSGTGAPLQAIITYLKSSYEKIVGVDLNHAYTL
jgi:methylase of polypeptide subunit release factors